jgi:hypothetical protein
MIQFHSSRSTSQRTCDVRALDEQSDYSLACTVKIQVITWCGINRISTAFAQYAVTGDSYSTVFRRNWRWPEDIKCRFYVCSSVTLNSKYSLLEYKRYVPIFWNCHGHQMYGEELFFFWLVGAIFFYRNEGLNDNGLTNIARKMTTTNDYNSLRNIRCISTNR